MDEDDLNILLANWGTCPSPCPPYCEGDLNEDCTVGVPDLNILLLQWNRTCGEQQDEKESMAGGGVSHDGLTLNEALEVFGFESVEEFNEWTAVAESHEVHDVAIELLFLMIYPAE